MPKRAPGARAKGIGAKLREYRIEAGFTRLESVAEQLGWNKARLSRLETGVTNPTVDVVASLLTIYRINDDRRERLLEAVRAVDEPGWWEKTAGMTKESATLADYEHEASELISWAPLLIPGLLQTMDYAGAFLETSGLGPDDIGARLGARRERQRAVSARRYTAYIGEPALRAVVGGRRVMDAQLTALERRDDVTIRVVPTLCAAHSGQLGGFLLLRFPSAPVVVHHEMLASGVFLDDPALTAPYETAVTQIGAVALGETESARLITQIREEMED